MKSIVYYTDSRLEKELDVAVRRQILKANVPIISVSQVPLDFGMNICVGRKPRSYISLYEQLLTGLEAAEKDSLIYLCEHDVFYHPTYFGYEPSDDYGIYFNLNRFFFKRGLDSFYPATGTRALSQAVANREILISHAKERLWKWKNGKSSFMKGAFLTWTSKLPNVDIRHGGNFSAGNKDKGSYLYGCKKGLGKIDGWGTVKQFQNIVGYKNLNVGTYDYLRKRFGNKKVADGFFREDLAILFQELGMTKGAEIGVKKGFYSALLCMLNQPLRLKCVDPWSPYENVSWDEVEMNFIHAKNNLSPFNVEIIRKTSLQAADDVPKSSLDFVYIDGDHSFNEVMRDIIVWSDRVRPGGIVSGHDYTFENHGVKLAVDAYTKAHEIEFFVTDKGDKYPDNSPSWFFAKGDL